MRRALWLVQVVGRLFALGLLAGTVSHVTYPWVSVVVAAAVGAGLGMFLSDEQWPASESER